MESIIFVFLGYKTRLGSCQQRAEKIPKRVPQKNTENKPRKLIIIIIVITIIIIIIINFLLCALADLIPIYLLMERGILIHDQRAP